MLELVRARRASKKGTKLVSIERYSEASFAFTDARELFRKAGNYEKAAVACIEAKAAMKLAKKQSVSGVPTSTPSKETQTLIVQRWEDKIRDMVNDKSGTMSLAVETERKLGHK